MKFDFLQIYFFLIRHKEINKNKNISQESCVVKVCKNTTLFVKGFDGVLSQRQRLTNGKLKLADIITCDENSRTDNWMTGNWAALAWKFNWLTSITVQTMTAVVMQVVVSVMMRTLILQMNLIRLRRSLNITTGPQWLQDPKSSRSNRHQGC